MQNLPAQIKLIAIFVTGILAIVLILLINPFVIIEAGHRGVVLNWGAVSGKVLNEGIHWVTPIAQSVQKIEVRTQKYEATASAYSKDTQTVETQIVLTYHIKPEAVNTIYQELAMEYESKIVAPAIQESVKAITARFTAQELIEDRQKVKDEISSIVAERLSKRDIVAEELSITNFSFKDAYEAAIEAKQVSQQTALKAENDLTRIKVEAQQTIETAKAQAEAIRISAQAINSTGGKDYVQLEAIKKWNGVLPAQMIPGATVPFINLTK